MRASVLIALLLGGCTSPAILSPALADEATHTHPWRVETLVTVHRFMGDTPRADPDQPSLRYGLYGGRWKAMAGDGVVLVGADSTNLRIGLALEGLIELVNFDTGFPVPWESYRANIGFEVLAESPALSRALLPRGGRVHVALGWFHESDHAANQSAYVAQYLALFGGSYRPPLDNGNFSSYEYVKIRAAYEQPLWGGRLTVFSAVGARLFPKPFDPLSIRALRDAVFTEGRISVRATDRMRPYASAYYELVDNGFVARDHGFLFGLDGEPLRYAVVHLGVDLVGTGGSIFSPFLTYTSSNGRGIDFPRFFGPEIGVGFAILP